ncbi:GH1 family beta-glucosidase [Comamonas composti]|uniref:GH1 family beta-glucosidase n=1 Tax=Comamonas composti TaxID=408558 RepID=UPI000686C30B|nr:GH1 family beta-glucosidase [Comamonas composti]
MTLAALIKLPTQLAPPVNSPMRDRDFTWGVATASYQIEGATDADGRLPSIWDTYCATPGKVLNGDSGDVACDHYHRWELDVNLIADLGVDAYRLSIAWPRVIGLDGQLNTKGVDFYKRLLDRLGDKGVQRYATLYHWDLPQHLEDRGGWLNRDTAYRFADYADKISRALQGRVTAWSTLNEPWCSAYLGYTNGRHAPGRTHPRYAAQALHHLLLGHGLAQPALKANDPGAQRSIVVNIGRGVPEDPGSAADRDAAHLFEVQQNAWVLDALLDGRYPDELFRLWPGTEPLVLEGDMDLISQPLDHLGINYYYRNTLRSDGAHGFTSVNRPGAEYTQMGWEVAPDAFTELLVGFHQRYANLPPIVITENGMASADVVVNGEIKDTQRISYLQRHFAAVHNAMAAGVDVRGYFVWSLLDNFEWAYGYERRFGLVHVDYETQVRTLKHSAQGLQAFLRERAGR